MWFNEISFPALGLELNPDRVAFTVFGKSIYWYGVIIALGFLLAAVYVMKRAGDFDLIADDVIDILIFAVPSAIICARAYYCIFNWSLFSANPVRVFFIWEGGLAIYGGIIGGLLSAAAVSKVKGLKALSVLDLGALGLLIGQAIGRWGNFINREAFGMQTDSFLKMGLTDAAGRTIYVYPTFLYESVWNAAGLLFLHIFTKKRRRSFDGQIFLMYVAWYGLGRGFIEGLRSDSLYLFSTGIRVSQALAFTSMAAACLALIYRLWLRPKVTEGDKEGVKTLGKDTEAVGAENSAPSETLDKELFDESDNN